MELAWFKIPFLRALMNAISPLELKELEINHLEILSPRYLFDFSLVSLVLEMPQKQSKAHKASLSTGP